MSAELIDGRAIARAIRANVAMDVAHMKTPPGLAAILVGDDPASALYVRLKEKAARGAGIHFECRKLPTTIDEETLHVQIESLNRRADIHGILVQLPLPKHIRTNRIMQAITPKKDVDGFHPENIDLLLAGTPRIIPVLPSAIMELITSTGETLEGKSAVILANSTIFAAPLQYLLEQSGMHARRFSKSVVQKTSSHPSRADILITALGIADIVRPEHVKKGAIVIDVGTTQMDDGVTGDVHIDVMKKAGWLTPVPGGVGPVTVALLLANTVHATTLQRVT
jgi:methylenetetrahydrofolate dehydrogenase (NADP+) / methenyltetrahydrofolate cyclohydrolase